MCVIVKWNEETIASSIGIVVHMDVKCLETVVFKCHYASSPAGVL